jgi:sugar phosphate isomerase/epimerase
MTLDEVINNTVSMTLRHINIKPELHLPYDTSPAQLKEARKRLDDAGLELGGTGTTYLLKNDEAEVRSRFEYNKTLKSFDGERDQRGSCAANREIRQGVRRSKLRSKDWIDVWVCVWT